MILHLYERAIRVRCAFPLIVAAAIALMTLNELSYQSSHQTLRHGIGLTLARITSQRTLQLVTDAELAVRARMLASGRRTLSPSELRSANCQRRAKPPSG